MGKERQEEMSHFTTIPELEVHGGIFSCTGLTRINWKFEIRSTFDWAFDWAHAEVSRRSHFCKNFI